MQPVGRFGFHIEIRRPLPFCRYIIRYFIEIIYRIIAFKPCAPTSHSYIYKEIQNRDCSWTVLDKAGLQGPETGNRKLVLEMGLNKDWRKEIGSQSLEWGLNKDWRLETGSQSLEWEPNKDWRKEIGSQSLKWGLNKDWRKGIESQSLEWG